MNSKKNERILLRTGSNSLLDVTDKEGFFARAFNVILPGKVLKTGSYRPKDLGLDLAFPLIKMIHVGRCGPDKYYQWSEIAHAHKVTHEGHICMRSGHYIWDSRGDIHEVLWHEYGHVISPASEDHGPEWIETMKMLGKPNINTPHSSVFVYETPKRRIFARFAEWALGIDG